MGEALTAFLLCEHAAGRVGGVIGIGGSGGTEIVTQAMRALPVGLPKLMVSTLASGNTAPYVGVADILMMHSVVDIAGLNAVSRRVLANAAAAMAGMVQQHPAPVGGQPTLAMTMFGVTTPCVTSVRRMLEDRGFDCLVFHATGTGGKAMEKLVEAGLVGGVLDITTTEVADHLVGGILACGPDRFEPTLRARVPLVFIAGRSRYGQLRRGRNGPRAVSRPAFPCAQRPCHADANHARRESPLRPLDRRQAQSGGSAVLRRHPREGRLGA